jgi:hypothetical protein
MSSATSIDGASAKDMPGARNRAAGASGTRDAFQPWHFFVLLSLLAATVAVVTARQSSPEHLILISLTVGAAGFAAAALYRTLAPLVREDLQGFDAPLTDSLRAVLEREKALLLRSIKELEFDRAMGKVSPQDFDEMAGRLRSRAMALMRQLDSGAGYQEIVERELSARLRKQGGRQGAARSLPPTAPPAAAEPPVPAAAAAARCACGTVNDPDAAFCKRCGTKLAASPAS